MTDKELAKLKRSELLRLMIEQGEVLSQTQAKLDEANRQLENRRLSIEQAGTLADAAASVNNLLEAAQATAEQYLENVREFCDQQERAIKAQVARTDIDCQRQLDDARKEAANILFEARKEAEGIIAAARSNALDVNILTGSNDDTILPIETVLPDGE